MKAESAHQVILHEDRPEFFRGCVYLSESNKIYCPDGEIRGQRAFNSRYGHRQYFDSQGKKIPSAWAAFVTAADIIRAETFNLSSLCAEIEDWLKMEGAAANRRDAEIERLAEQLELIRAIEGRRSARRAY